MKLKNALILLLTATIWGVAFVAQSVGMDYVQPFTFNGVRSIIGGLVLIPVILVLDRKKKAEEKDYKAPGDRKTLILGGICCGVALGIATNLQQFGVMYTYSRFFYLNKITNSYILSNYRLWTNISKRTNSSIISNFTF